jgi:hypothetical protein
VGGQPPGQGTFWKVVVRADGVWRNFGDVLVEPSIEVEQLQLSERQIRQVYTDAGVGERDGHRQSGIDVKATTCAGDEDAARPAQGGDVSPTGIHTTVAATTVVAPATASAATPTSAAASCPDYVAAGGTTPTEDIIVKAPSAAVHDGPAAKCHVYDYVSYGTHIYKWCSWFNATTGNWWTYTNWGWIYAGYFRNGLDDDVCDEWYRLDPMVSRCDCPTRGAPSSGSGSHACATCHCRTLTMSCSVSRSC